MTLPHEHHKLYWEFYSTDVPTMPETLRVLDVMEALRDRLAISEDKVSRLQLSYEILNRDYAKLRGEVGDLRDLIERLRDRFDDLKKTGVE